ncbi:MAG: M20 family metallopeptidase [Sedimentisphaerales bacterium]|nr:M20 family metallopeptidase [Sedimentisphaerales bacterium]
MKELLKKLIQADSTLNKGELATAEVIRKHFEKNGIESELSNWDGNRANVVAHIKSTGEKSGLLFACHLDVVPPGEQQWKYPPFSATEEDGKIYGRGATDMKGSTAALITAIVDLVKSGVDLKGDIIFAATAGEETDSCGVHKFVSEYKDKLPELAGVIVAEPTDFKVITTHRGIFWLEVITKGRTAHGSRPDTGINAINSMRQFLDEAQKYDFGRIEHPKLGKCSMSINAVNAGEAINVVPDRCSAKIDIRTVPGIENRQILDKFEEIFAVLKAKNKDFDAEVSVVRNVPALETDNECDFVKQICSAIGAIETTAVGYGTDGPFFAELGYPIVICGVCDNSTCHQPDEFVEFNELKKGVEVYKKIIANFSQTDKHSV